MNPTRTYGIELTALPHNYTEEAYNEPPILFSHNKYYTKLTEQAANISSKGIKCKIDNHCLEFNSPVFNNWTEMSTWYRSIREKVFKPHKLIPKLSHITVDGGCHLHIGGLSLDKKLRVVKDAAQRPFIPWIFTEPDDTDSCCNWVVDNYGLMYHVAIKLESVKAKKKYFTKYLAIAPESQGAHELEIRCIESPYNESELKDQFDFFTRYVEFALTTIESDIVPYTMKSLNAITPQTCIERFKMLLFCLDLPYERYEKYVKRNLYTRWKLGRKRV